MKVFKAIDHNEFNSDNLAQWQQIDQVIRANLTPTQKMAWMVNGYASVCEWAPEQYGMHRMYRDTDQCITFEFTDEQWTWFALKWLNS